MNAHRALGLPRDVIDQADIQSGDSEQFDDPIQGLRAKSRVGVVASVWISLRHGNTLDRQLL